MAAILAKLDINQKTLVEQFVKDITRSLEMSPFIRNSFIYTIDKNNELYLIVSVDGYNFIEPAVVGGLLACLVYVMFGLNFWFWLGIFIACFQYFKSSYFYSYVLKTSLKKKGYVGNIVLL